MWYIQRYHEYEMSKNPSRLSLPFVDSGTDADIDDTEPEPVTRSQRKRRRLASKQPTPTDGVPDRTLQDLRHRRKYNPSMREVLVQFLEERREIEDNLLRVLKLEEVLHNY